VDALFELLHALAERTGHLGQLLGPQDDQGDHEHDQDFLRTDGSEHGGSFQEANARRIDETREHAVSREGETAHRALLPIFALERPIDRKSKRERKLRAVLDRSDALLCRELGAPSFAPLHPFSCGPGRSAFWKGTHVADLVIEGLRAEIDGKEILKGIDLEVSKGEVHAVMGPNGSGKSTLSYVLMGHPAYEVTAGSVTFKGVDLLELEPDERSRLGMFLAFQYPHAVPGVTVSNFLRQAINAHRKGGPDGADNPISAKEFGNKFRAALEMLKVDKSLSSRYLNDGFSGGEKKRLEILQMAMLEPELAILDETASALDIGALQIVAQGVNTLAGPELGVLVITHYQRTLNYIRPDHVHILMDGRIVRSGGAELALELEQSGYAGVAPQQEV